MVDAVYEDRAVGALLGAMVGDALGAAGEFNTRESMLRRFPPDGWVREMSSNASGTHVPGTYTDDTEMTIALAQSLNICHKICAEHVSHLHALAFNTSNRGYAKGAALTLQRLYDGWDFRKTGRSVFPQGSYANGGCMRISPVGLAFRHATDEVLWKAVEYAIMATHCHPEGIDGAFLQAKAVAYCALYRDPIDRFDGLAFLRTLQASAHTDRLRGMMQKLVDLLPRADGREDYDIFKEFCEVSQDTGDIFQISACEAVGCALWTVARYAQHPAEGLMRLIACGGDADTVGSMAAAIFGALHGLSWLPPRWLDRLESSAPTAAVPSGRALLQAEARRLATLDLGRDPPARDPAGAWLSHPDVVLMWDGPQDDLPLCVERRAKQAQLRHDYQLVPVPTTAAATAPAPPGCERAPPRLLAADFSLRHEGPLHQLLPLPAPPAPTAAVLAGGEDGLRVWSLAAPVRQWAADGTHGAVRVWCWHWEDEREAGQQGGREQERQLQRRLRVWTGDQSGEVHEWLLTITASGATQPASPVTLAHICTLPNAAGPSSGVAAVRKAPVGLCLWQPDVLVGAMGDCSLAVWRRASPGCWHCLAHIRAHTRPLTGLLRLRLPTSDDLLATASLDGTVRLWSLAPLLAAGAGDKAAAERAAGVGLLRTGHQGGVVALGAMAEEGRLVTCGKDGLRHWDLTATTPVLLAHHPDQPNITCLAITPRWLVTGSSDHSLCLRPRRASVPATLIRQAHTTALTALCPLAAPYDHLLASGAAGGELYLWDLEARRSLAVMRGGTRGPTVATGALVPLPTTADEQQQQPQHQQQQQQQQQQRQVLVVGYEDRFVRQFALMPSVLGGELPQTPAAAADPADAPWPSPLSLPSSLHTAELSRLLHLWPLVHSPEQLARDYGAAEAAEMTEGLRGQGLTALLPCLAQPGVATRWRHFVGWCRSENPDTLSDPTAVFARYAAHLGRVRTYRALALTPAQHAHILAQNAIASTGHLRASPAVVLQTLRQEGLRKVVVARLYIGLGLVPCDPSISLHDDCETTLTIASGYLEADRRVYLYEVHVPVVETVGWTVNEVSLRSEPVVGQPMDPSRWFCFHRVWFDGCNPRTERYGLLEVAFLKERLVSLRVFENRAQIEEVVGPFREHQRQLHEANPG
ncbi:putative ADPribosylglycohydrolase superfamily protein [Paratrimastix pyriformis]|uniref:ADP-ribosylhydrolase ARH3 n=1 Tax=Paratrimastix pyriformis TaxID=342808 RepID=A0ABQ8UEB0_9EUKA|nr:putative ADPribosylglycohydrolase superfamily protein [Paratrimastix pyriformis]